VNDIGQHADRPAAAEEAPVPPRQAFAAALAQHKAGDLRQAERLYRQVLTAEPRHSDSLHLLGVIASQTGRSGLAVDLIGQALALAPDTAVYHSNLGNALVPLGRLEEAAACQRRAIALDPLLADAHLSLGRTLRRLGCPREAADCYRDALRLDPGDLRGLLGLGDSLAEQDRFDEAADHYHAALALAPEDPGANNNLGAMLHRLGQADAAAARFRRALDSDPDHEEALFNLGTLLREQQDQVAAMACYRRAVGLNPNRADTHNNMGAILLLQDRAAESIACFATALRLRPIYPEAQSNLGVAYARLQQPGAAIAAFRTAIALRPDHAEAHNNLAMALLSVGDMAAGWPEYEWRWQAEPNINRHPGFSQPQWMGEPGHGRTLLIHAEQGFGDTLQFCRFAPLARDRGLRVVIAAPRALIRLLGGLAGADALVAQGDPLPPFDLHCPMLSLPLALGTTVETIPAAIPYLHADTAEAASWRARLAPADAAGLRVGLVWAGHRNDTLAITAAVDRQRSLAPAQMAPLLAVPGLQFFSLQKDGPRAPATLALHDHMHEMHDFADTAALVANMDLVISVDSAVAHLAGALGRPVWLLDRFGHCWRWLHGRHDSPWYPDLRIFRQPAPGAWDPVLAEVAAALHELADAWRSVAAGKFSLAQEAG